MNNIGKTTFRLNYSGSLKLFSRIITHNKAVQRGYFAALLARVN